MGICLGLFVLHGCRGFLLQMCKLRMAPSCVAVGQLASQYGVVWVVCMWGVVVDFSFDVPSLARVSAISFPVMLV